MVPKREHLPRVLAIIGVLGAGAAASIAFTPVLLGHAPLLFIALGPFGRHLVMAAPESPMVWFIVIGTLRRALASGLAYYLGYIFGDDALVWAEGRYPRLGRFARVLERFFRRVGAPLVMVAPLLSISALAGVVRMSFWLFVPVALVGHAIWVTAIFFLGDALGEWIRPINAFLREHMFVATAVCIAGVALYQLYRIRTRRGDPLAELAAASEKSQQ